MRSFMVGFSFVQWVFAVGCGVLTDAPDSASGGRYCGSPSGSGVRWRSEPPAGSWLSARRAGKVLNDHWSIYFNGRVVWS
ncbi:hypothetical protein SBV1_970013 [Verrucomicrobia bacterium]|nr:hypothetical protein SBV1_970013 [Verrucomicrobiota bacterium]